MTARARVYHKFGKEGCHAAEVLGTGGKAPTDPDGEGGEDGTVGDTGALVTCPAATRALGPVTVVELAGIDEVRLGLTKAPSGSSLVGAACAVAATQRSQITAITESRLSAHTQSYHRWPWHPSQHP